MDPIDSSLNPPQPSSPQGTALAGISLLTAIERRRDYYDRWARVWWTTFLVFLVGGSFTAAFGSAFNFVEKTDHVLWGTIALIGGICASVTSALTPDKRSNWFWKAYNHLDVAILRFKDRQIDMTQLINARDQAENLSSGR